MPSGSSWGGRGGDGASSPSDAGKTGKTLFMGVQDKYPAQFFLKIIVFSMHLLNSTKIEHIVYLHYFCLTKWNRFVIIVLVVVNKYCKAILHEKNIILKPIGLLKYLVFPLSHNCPKEPNRTPG